MTPNSIPVFVSDYGIFRIPPNLQDVPIRKDGWPDMRFNRAADLLHWLDEQERGVRDT